jgi:glycosyltransferase involved in cell wall biosynthesis
MEEVIPKLVICVVTYNHEHYITQCLDSLLHQKTDFDFKLLISDDASKDRTPFILEEYKQKYPNQIMLFNHKQNMGAYKNFVFVHTQAAAQYIAHVDGDDYTLPGKLQKQVDFLEANPQYNIVWHRNYILNESTQQLLPDLIQYEKLQHIEFTRKEVILFPSIGTNSSKMYRSSVKSFDIPSFDVMDYFMNVEQIKQGKAGFISNEILGVYRSGVGISSANSHTSFILAKSINYFRIKYKKERKYINAVSLFLLLVSIKNKRKVWRMHAVNFVKSFHPLSPFLLFKFKPIFAMFRSPFK